MVLAEASGLSPVAQNVIVNVGLDTVADFDMTKVEKKVEQLTVTAAAPLVETTRDVLGEIVDRRLVAELPLNGRDFGKLVALLPGATVDPSGVAGTQGGFGQFNINGNRDRSNNYTLDGTDDNDPFFNNSALNQTGISGAPASLLPIDAIQEFNLESQFGAEYGRNSGSVVNIVTSRAPTSFTDRLWIFRNSALDARNYFNTEPQSRCFRTAILVPRWAGHGEGQNIFLCGVRGTERAGGIGFPASGADYGANRGGASHRAAVKRRGQSIPGWTRFLSFIRRVRPDRWPQKQETAMTATTSS